MSPTYRCFSLPRKHKYYSVAATAQWFLEGQRWYGAKGFQKAAASFAPGDLDVVSQSLMRRRKYISPRGDRTGTDSFGGIFYTPSDGVCSRSFQGWVA